MEIVTNELDNQLANLVHVSWVVLIPLGVLLSLVLFKVLMLLQSVYEFWTVARHELSPAMQDLRKTASHVEVLTGKAVDSVSTVERGMQATAPVLQQGLDRLQNAKDTVKGSLVGLIRAFRG